MNELNLTYLPVAIAILGLGLLLIGLSSYFEQRSRVKPQKQNVLAGSSLELFYRLKESFGDGYEILPNFRLDDIIQSSVAPRTTAGEKQAVILICTKGDLEPIVLVKTGQSVKRLNKLEESLVLIGIPTVFLESGRSYDAPSLIQIIEERIGSSILPIKIKKTRKRSAR